MEFGLNAYHRLPDKHPQKSYEFLLALIDHQIKSDRELDMKEKSVKSMMKSGGKDAAPAAGKQEGQSGKGKKGKSNGPDAAPVLPKDKAKGHAGKNGKSDGANDRGKSPSGNKENPCWYHFKAEKGCLKGNECTFSHSKKTEHQLENLPKGKGKGKSKSRSSSPKREDGACFAFQKGSACKYKHELIKNNSAPATSSDKAQAKSKAAAKNAAPAIVRRAIAMPAIVLKQSAPAGKVSFKKDVDQVEPDETETVYHERDDDAMSESSRWSGESEIPEKMVWFKEVLDVDENGEITYLEDESRQWERKGEWHGYEGNEDGPYQYVHIDEKKFKSSDHRELSAYQVQRSLIRAKILEEVVEDVYRNHYFPVTKESAIVIEYDRNKDEIKEAAIDWKKQHGLPKNVFALSTCVSKRVKWLMDTGCGRDLIGRAKAKSLDELDETVEPHVLDETPTVFNWEKMHEDGICFSLDAW